MNNNLLTAEQLYKKSYIPQINTIVNDIYRTIQFKIVDLHKSGASEIYFDLVDNIQIGNLELKDAQLIIYSKLIEMFEQGGFKVGIIFGDEDTKIHIRWPSILDPSETTRMKNIINNHIEKAN